MFQTRLLNKKNSSRYKVHEYCIYFLRADDQGLNSFKCQKYNDFNENTIKKFNVIDLLVVCALPRFSYTKKDVNNCLKNEL